MKQIELTRGQYSPVDDEDYEWLNQWNWFALGFNHAPGRFMAARNSPWVDGKRTVILMHRLLMNAEPGLDVDHRDRDPLNNQRHNLRVCTHQQNVRNRGALKSKTYTKFKGVFCYPRLQYKNPWIAKISINGVLKSLGSFSTEEEAARAYDRVARDLHGEFACLNFPVVLLSNTLEAVSA